MTWRGWVQPPTLSVNHAVMMCPAERDQVVIVVGAASTALDDVVWLESVRAGTTFDLALAVVAGEDAAPLARRQSTRASTGLAGCAVSVSQIDLDSFGTEDLLERRRSNPTSRQQLRTRLAVRSRCGRCVDSDDSHRGAGRCGAVVPSERVVRHRHERVEALRRPGRTVVDSGVEPVGPLIERTLDDVDVGGRCLAPEAAGSAIELALGCKVPCEMGVTFICGGDGERSSCIPGGSEEVVSPSLQPCVVVDAGSDELGLGDGPISAHVALGQLLGEDICRRPGGSEEAFGRTRVPVEALCEPFGHRPAPIHKVDLSLVETTNQFELLGAPGANLVFQLDESLLEGID